MEILKLIAWVIFFIIMMIWLYWMAKGNEDYKRNQRYGVPRYESSRHNERK